MKDIIAKLPVEANPWKISVESILATPTQKLSDFAEGSSLELTASSAPAWEEAKGHSQALHDPSLKNLKQPPFGA
eukprot:CAMPEP_0172901628 /NCGR_PEP_ID=MMETSP1075-20121228/166664_1 /TAXON_ID=2916 /ORGANISM="Ceratium fusus, Strain PA161109" /LENGTH=74 /DNA_ID=CAMNT_0013758069 /DNA_START=60 /DNA_END=284 /DNA_ORIENTATION=+